MLTTPFTEGEWANEVPTFEGAEAAQTHIHEFCKTVSFECRNLAVPHSVRKKIAENRGIKSPGLDKLASHKQNAVIQSQRKVEASGENLTSSSILYQDDDSRLYLKATEVRSRYVAELAVHTSDRVENEVKEIDAVVKEVASGLLVSKMDL